MPSISGRVTRNRIVVPVALVLRRAGSSSPFDVNLYPTSGLIDTGAQSTSISREAVRRLGLKSQGKRMMGNAHSDEVHDTYAFRLAFYVVSEIGSSEQPWHVDRDVVGADIKPNPAFELLIGMDIIGMGDLSVHRDGTFEFVLP